MRPCRLRKTATGLVSRYLVVKRFWESSWYLGWQYRRSCFSTVNPLLSQRILVTVSSIGTLDARKTACVTKLWFSIDLSSCSSWAVSHQKHLACNFAHGQWLHRPLACILPLALLLAACLHRPLVRQPPSSTIIHHALSRKSFLRLTSVCCFV